MQTAGHRRRLPPHVARRGPAALPPRLRTESAVQPAEIRRRFLQHFEQRGHTVVPSASLVSPDPSLLFTVAGMGPFIPHLTGPPPPPPRWRPPTRPRCSPPPGWCPSSRP